MKPSSLIKLFVVPQLDLMGGISNYYLTIRSYLNSGTEYLIRYKTKQPFKKLLVFLSFNFRFIYKIVIAKPRLVLVNTSLDFSSLFRDSFLLLISKLFRVKVIFFYRGWHEEFEKISRNYFLWALKRADAHIVLSKLFKQKLRCWGISKPIFTETTAIKDELTAEITSEKIIKKYSEKKGEYSILFFSRIEKYKGIYEAVDAYKELQILGFNVKLNIAGNGGELDNVKKYIFKKRIKGVKFLGYIRGEEKAKALFSNDILLFPSYSEGMPNAVIEAMAFGLPIITTRVGGINDFFKDGEMGYSIAKSDIREIVKYTRLLFEESDIRGKIAVNNFNFARENFYASVVANRIESIADKIIG